MVGHGRLTLTERQRLAAQRPRKAGGSGCPPIAPVHFFAARPTGRALTHLTVWAGALLMSGTIALAVWHGWVTLHPWLPGHGPLIEWLLPPVQ